MNYILKREIKFYTKECLKYLSMIVIAFGFISGMLFIKYKPVYSVTLGDKNVGYIENKEDFDKIVEENIINYTSKNIDSVSIKDMPTYKLSFINKETQTNEKEILIAMQKDMDITYKYYQIALDNEVIESVDSNEDAQNIVNELKQKDNNLNLTIIEQTTTNAEEIKTNNIEVAKSNINNKIESIKENESVIGEIQGIKLAAKPVEGTISSRYGVSSSIRKSTHTGLDIATSTGTPIHVVSDGTIISASYSGSYGNLVKVDHGNGIETWYAHTSKMYVTPGQQVKAGEVIAAVGSTGNSTGPHLHFEIRINGNHVNPQIYMYN